MPSLVEKMQPWSQTHSFLPTNLLRRSWSSSSSSGSNSNSRTNPIPSSSSTTSLLSTGSGVPSKTPDGGKTSSSSSSSKSGSGSNSQSQNQNTSIFRRICGGGDSKTVSGSSSGAKNVQKSETHEPRPKRKTPILSTCMSNWVKFDHDCQKPLPCPECESNQERNRKVLFTSGGNMLLTTGSSKGSKHPHRHSSHFFSGGSGSSGSTSSGHSSGSSLSHHHHRHHHHLPSSISEPTTPTDCGGSGSSGSSSSSSGVSSGSGSAGSSHSDPTSPSPSPAFAGEVVSSENNGRNNGGSRSNSFKIVINVPCLDMNLFQNENIQVEIVCNKNKLATGKDFEIVQRNRTELKASGWYWEGIDSEASMEILDSEKPGAFIIRDSSDPRFLYSLSIQTERGPTSVRLIYRSGKFSLDAEEKLLEVLPKFDSVIRLIEHYVNGGTKVGNQVWIDPRGNMHSTVKLSKPVRKEVGSLKHLARVALNRNNLISKKDNPTPVPSGAIYVNTSAGAGATATAATTPSTSKGTASTTTVTSPVTDLSKLPPSLQNYILDYPYNL